MAQGDWIPTRADAHPAAESIALGAGFDFVAPAAANGFLLGADGPLSVTFDGSTASATNGLGIDPGKGATGLFPITPNGKISVFNLHTAPITVTVAWLERLG